MKLQRIESGDWASCLTHLGRKTLADGKAVMLDRIEKGKDNNEHVDKGTWLAENTNVVDGNILMARKDYNPLISYAKQAVTAHRIGRDFFLNDNILLQKRPVTQVLAEIVKADKNKPLHKRRVFTPSQRKTYNVSWDKFADDDVIAWHAQGNKLAREYGKFVHNDFGIDSVTVYLPVTSLGNIAIGNWLCGLVRDGRSGFGCSLGDLNDDNGSVFGVDFSAEGTPQKISREKVRISGPSLAEVLRFSRKYVPEVTRQEYESGISSLFGKK